MTAPTSLAETLAKVTYQHLRTSTSGWYDSAPVVGCACGVGLANTPHADHVARAQAVVARAWLVTRLAEQGPAVIDAHAFVMSTPPSPRLSDLGWGWGCRCREGYKGAHAAHVAAALAGVLTDE